jgi:hypothetical protein
MDSREIQAIDVHGHYGPYATPRCHGLINQWMSGDAEEVVERAKTANIELTIVSPLLGLLPRGEADAAEGNDDAERIVPRFKELRQWVIVDPRNPKTYEQAEAALEHPHCVGIKIHGEEHIYYIRDHGDAIFEFAAKHRAVIMAHSGHRHTMPLDFVPFADRYPEAKLILAHLGNNGDCEDKDPTHQVRAVQASKHGNVFTDTSSARSILPHLIEYAVSEVGAEKILFGTDTPLYHSCNQRARIDGADFGDDAKRRILRNNAVELLDLNS